MLLIIAGLFFFGFVFVGIGLLISRPDIDSAGEIKNFPRRFWIGLAFSIGFLQIWHLFLPINLACLIVHILAALAGYILARKNVVGALRQMKWQNALPGVMVMILTGIVIGSFSIDGNLHFDHGMYHLQTVQWLENYAIVPGLGNVHHRLAFNNASFLYVSLLNQGIFHGYAFYIANSLLAWVLVLQCLLSVINLIMRDGLLMKADYFYALILPFFLWFMPNFYFSGYSPDLFIAVLQMLLAGELLALAENINNPASLRRNVNLILLLGVLMICIKLSGLVYAAAFMLAAIIIFFKTNLGDKQELKFLWSRIPMLLLLGVPWLVRSVILSGYLVYPSAMISFDFIWKIPRTMVEPITGVIYNWSRYGSTISPDTPFLQWLPQWLWTVPRGLREGWILGSALLLVFLVIWASKKFRLQDYKSQFLVIGFALLHILYWFLAAPEIRFIGMAYWIAFAVLLSVLVEWFAQLKPQVSKKGMSLAIIAVSMFWLNPEVPRDFGLTRTLVKPPSEYKIASQFVSHDDLVSKTTLSGLTVYLANDESLQGCWDLPLPCTRVADYYSKLALIDPNDMQKGFYIKMPE